MQAIAPVILLVLAFALAGFANAAPKQADEPEIRVVTVPVQKAARGKAPTPGVPGYPTGLWWNDPKIGKALSLTDEQREKMAESLKAYHKKVPESQTPKMFHETLVQGDWKQARRESDKLGKRAAQSIQLRGTLKISILSLLSEEQLKILVDRYPRLIYKPWRSAMSGESPR